MAGNDGGILVNHAALDQAADDLVNAVKQIQGRMEQLEHELAPLRNDWEGQAQLAYTDAKNKWDTAIGQMVTILQDTSNAVHQANGEYTSADNKGAQGFAGIA